MARPKTYRVKKGKHYPIKRRSAPGAAPGTLIADPEAHELEARVITYSGETFEEVVDAGIEKIREIRFKSDQVLWLDIVGLRDVAFIQQIGELFGLHRLALEDVINLHQRPKVEEYNDYFFVTARTLLAQKGNETEQVSFFLGKNFLVSFQEKKGDCFEPLRKRLREGKGLIRETKEDHLLYALLDAIIDNYFPALERIGEELEVCEDAVITNPEPSVTQRLHSLKRNLLTLRRAIWPQREMLNALIRDDSVDPPANAYLSQRLLRPRHPVNGYDRDIPRDCLGITGYLSFQYQQPHERNHEGIDDYCHDFYSFELHYRVIWNEF